MLGTNLDPVSFFVLLLNWFIGYMQALVNLGNSRATGSLCSSRFDDSGDAPLGNMEDWSKQSGPGFDVMKMS